MVLAVILGLITALLVGVYLKNQTPRQSNVPVSVVVAAQAIPASTVIEADMVRQEQAPASEIPADAALEKQNVVGKIAIVGLTKDERILASQLQDKEILGLAGRVPIGQRAVTVALDPIIGVAGFLKPGNHVDVLATFNLNQGTVTKTVLQDQVLLATGAQVISKAVDTSGRANQPDEKVPNATLAVDPGDAEKLILAESKGKLRLTLRAVGDVVRVPSRGVTSRYLIGYVPPDVAQQQAAPAAAPAPRKAQFSGGALPISPFYNTSPARGFEPPAPPRREVEVIRGSQVERVPVKT